MANVIQTNYDTLDEIASAFGQQGEAVQQSTGKLGQAMSPLRNGGWIGKGSQAFFREMEDEVLPALRRLAAALEQARGTAGQIARLLHQTEDDASSPFKSAAGGGQGAGAAGMGGAAGAAVGAAAGSVWSEGRFSASSLSAVALAGMLDGRGFGSAAAEGLLSGAGTIGSLTGGNDYGIPRDWLSGVTDSLQGYMSSHQDDMMVPEDWLAGTKEALGATGAGSGVGMAADSAMGGAGMGGGMPAGGASGGGPAGGGPSGGSGSPTEGSRSTGSASPAGGGGGPMGGGGGGPSGSGTPAAGAGPAAQAGPLRYQPLGVGSSAGAAHAAAGGGPAGGGRAPVSAMPSGTQQANLGIPMGLAALGPLVALVGKAIKDRVEDR